MTVEQDRRTSGGLLVGAGVCVALAVASDLSLFMFVPAGLVFGAMAVYRRTAERRPYAYWVGWLTGSVIGLLLAWPAGESARPIVLALAGAEAVVAVVLFMLWLSGRARDTGGRQRG
ncbi:hypothetical protein ACF09E_34940 [Streptomyces sp. NPDC014891]|uniref:hypothetical protein n=1 Tax=Streptomyces sp. NPDC014891 TaxID=3364929 RepID=UPI0036FE606C